MNTPEEKIKEFVDYMNNQNGWFYWLTFKSSNDARRVWSEDHSCSWIEQDFIIKGTCEYNFRLNFEIRVLVVQEGKKFWYGLFNICSDDFDDSVQLKEFKEKFWFYALLITKLG